MRSPLTNTFELSLNMAPLGICSRNVTGLLSLELYPFKMRSKFSSEHDDAAGSLAYFSRAASISAGKIFLLKKNRRRIEYSPFHSLPCGAANLEYFFSQTRCATS